MEESTQTLRPPVPPALRGGQDASERVLSRALSWARERDYAGFSKFDALESPFLRGILGWSRPARLIASQLVMRAPLNLRPLLGVPRARNPKGIALFACAYLSRFEALGDAEDGREARALLDWLCAAASRELGAPAWGYQHRWQDVGFYAPAGFPNRIVTAFVMEALLAGHRVLGDRRYLDTAVEAAEFMLHAPRVLHEDERTLCLSYVPTEKIRWRVMDVSALAARVLAQVAIAARRPDYLPAAARLLRFVVDRQTPAGAWYYADPPSASHLRHDNYHTGYILDAILVHADAAGSREFLPAYERGLQFYAENLFEADGAPRFQSHQPYPRDVHGAAQGIITFERAAAVDSSYRRLSDRILSWTLDNLWNEREARFYYQKTRFFTKRFTLMRWCQAWMAHALAYRLLQRRG